MPPRHAKEGAPKVFQGFWEPLFVHLKGNFQGGCMLEKFTYEGNNQRVIERFLMIVYSIYGINFAVSLSRQGVESWYITFVVLGLVLSWIVHAGKYKGYSFRARFTGIMMQVSLTLYALQTEDVLHVIPVFMPFIVILGLYGMKELIWYSVISSVVVFGYHTFVIYSMPLESPHEILSMILYFANILFLEYVVYVWTKRNSDGSKQLLCVIEELEAVERSKDDFLANVSHEIRTPLNTICGMSEIVLREELPYKTKENVLNIQMAGRTLMSVVSDILDYSELQSGEIALEEEAYSISSTINDVINMTLARKNEKKIELIVDCDADIPSALLGDEKKLRRIVMKLVDNALKFTEEGCVCISVGYRKESYGINLLITVKDTGIGMDEKSLEQVFTRFAQADTGRSRQEGGIGLGLAITNALIKKMGGAITVRSKPDKGTEVQIAVPQKVLDEAPMASIRNPERLNVATYIDMEQFDMSEIRDEYSATLLHMVEQLKVKCHICRNFSELQRADKKEQLTHVFTSVVEYRANQVYFDDLAQKMKVIVILDGFDEKYVTNPRLLKIYKPFHILTIVSVVNTPDGLEQMATATEKFETRDAHVLVVDDNRMNIRVMEGLLAHYKIKVTTATSGQEALQKISVSEFDFVFMDHMMPEMDGVETLRNIRHKVGTYFQKVPVIALTANAVAGTREMFLAEGFNDFLEKPVERSVMERVLKRHLPPEKVIYKKDVLQEAKVQQEETVQKVQTMQEESGTQAGLPTVAQLAAALEPRGLDVKQGVLYCNGMEGYIKVLQGYCHESDTLGIQAKELYEKEDWTNYVITVHGIKGAMRSIGATGLSELARRLEFAGKENRIDYIRENHGELMKEYRALFEGLRECKWIAVENTEEEDEMSAEMLSALEPEVFQQIVKDMEVAMYALDGERLLEIVAELQRHKYREASLKELLLPVRKKVEMCDYVSAVELTMRLKNQLDSKER